MTASAYYSSLSGTVARYYGLVDFDVRTGNVKQFLSELFPDDVEDETVTCTGTTEEAKSAVHDSSAIEE
eukprot:8094456-Pyramimonas_sp.AAC.1